MNKYKLVPYLVLSKEDAQLEVLQEEVAALLQDKSIDPTLKRALYEDLLQRIGRFKEDNLRKTISGVEIRSPNLPPPPPPHTSPVAEKNDGIVESTQSSVSKISSQEGDNIEDGEGSFQEVTPKHAKKKRKAPGVTPREEDKITPSVTRAGSEFVRPSLTPNRPLSKKMDWAATSLGPKPPLRAAAKTTATSKTPKPTAWRN